MREVKKSVCYMLLQAVKKDYGIGWKSEMGEVSAQRCSTGNAEILMLVLAFWELTKKQKYELLAEKI